MNTVKKQFSDALKREGKTVTTYYKNETIKCLFRINKDYNNTDNHVTIFYDIDSPIKQGQLLTYGNKVFIILNQETVENEVYYKSAILECNVIVPLVSNSVIQNIPCYAGDLFSAIQSDGKVIDVIDGRVDVFTESTDFVNNATLNSQSQFMGGYYDLKNKANKSGIAYLYFERGLAPEHTYLLELISDNDTYKVDTNTQLTAIAKTDGLTDASATIVYTSSDDLLATVDSTGSVTFKAEGVVTITAIWLEQSIQKTIELTISEEQVPESYIVEITQPDVIDDGIKLGLTYIFTGTVKDNFDNIVSPVNLVFTIDNNYGGEVAFTDNNNGTCTIKVNNNAWDLISEKFTLTCTDTISGFSGTWLLEIVGMW